MFSQNHKIFNIIQGKKKCFVVLTTTKSDGFYTEKNKIYIVFNQTTKIRLICGNDSVVIDFQKIKNIELTSNTSKKAISCFANLIHVKNKIRTVFKKTTKNDIQYVIITPLLYI